jgi:hypothetical protein
MASQMSGAADAVKKAMANLNPRTALLALSGAGAVSWIIAMAGTAAVHAECNSPPYFSFGSFSSSSIDSLVRSAGGLSNCTTLMQLPWWTVWFNLGIYIAVAYFVSDARRAPLRDERAAA